MISIARHGLPPAQVRVDGVVDLPQADSLFQKVGADRRSPAAGAAGQRPAAARGPVAPGLRPARRPDVPTWSRRRFTPGSATICPQTRPPHSPPSPRRPATPKPGWPAPGLVGDNLGAALGAAREDALYAQILFLFLGLPGAVLAGVLTVMIANSAAARRRREQALLRARGATARQLLRLAAVEALVVGLGGRRGRARAGRRHRRGGVRLGQLRRHRRHRGRLGGERGRRRAADRGGRRPGPRVAGPASDHGGRCPPCARDGRSGCGG